MSGNEAALDAGGGGSTGGSDTGGGGSTGDSDAGGSTSVTDQSPTGISGVAGMERAPPRAESVIDQSPTRQERSAVAPGGPISGETGADIDGEEVFGDRDATSGGPLDIVQTGVKAGADAVVPVPANPVDVAQDFANDPVDATTSSLTSPGVTAGTLAVTTANPSTPPLSPVVIGRGALLAGTAVAGGAAATTDRAQNLFGSESGTQTVTRPDGTIAPEAEPAASVPSLSAAIPVPAEPEAGTAEIPTPAEPEAGTAEIPTPTEPGVGSAEIGVPDSALGTGATVGERNVPLENPFGPTIDEPTGPTIDEPTDPAIDEDPGQPSIRRDEYEPFRFPADGTSESVERTDVARSRDPARQAIERLEIAQSPGVPDPGRPGQDLGELLSIGGADVEPDDQVGGREIIQTEPGVTGITDTAVATDDPPIAPVAPDAPVDATPELGEPTDTTLEVPDNPVEFGYETGVGDPTDPGIPPGTRDDPLTAGLGTPNTPNTPTTPGLPPFSGGGGGGGPQPPAFATGGALFPSAITGVDELFAEEEDDEEDELFAEEEDDEEDELFGLFGGV